MIKSLVSRISGLVFTDSYPITFILLKRNRSLIERNKLLRKRIEEQDQTIKILNQTLVTIENVKANNAASNN